MKTINEIKQDIVNKTMEITNEFPDLSSKIKEMSLKVSGMSIEGVSHQDLAEHYESLENLLKTRSEI